MWNCENYNINTMVIARNIISFNNIYEKYNGYYEKSNTIFVECCLITS